jgi:hypothetical protein
MRGGARKGAGRKPGSSKVGVGFKLERSTLALLRERVPKGQMTAFVERALLRALKARKRQSFFPLAGTGIPQNPRRIPPDRSK